MSMYLLMFSSILGPAWAQDAVATEAPAASPPALTVAAGHVDAFLAKIGGGVQNMPFDLFMNALVPEFEGLLQEVHTLGDGLDPERDAAAFAEVGVAAPLLLARLNFGISDLAKTLKAPPGFSKAEARALIEAKFVVPFQIKGCTLLDNQHALGQVFASSELSAPPVATWLDRGAALRGARGCP